MCRIEERIYVRADGNRSKFEETFRCDKSRNGKLCAKVNRRTTEYYPRTTTLTRDDTPSPINPPTPNSPGTYLVQQRRSSASSVRPSTRDGQRIAKPEIIIEFGSKKGKSIKYPSVSVSTGNYKRSSIGASSVGSSEIAIDSPGSDASHTLRTGFPDAPLSPSTVFSPNDSFISSPDVSRANHRHTSSASSFTSSSRTPSLYVTSDPDYDSPTGHANERYPTIVHNPPALISSSPSRSQSGTTKGYTIELVTPSGMSSESRTPEGLTPLDYSDRSTSSYASSGTHDSGRRSKDERRKKKEEDRKRQDELDRLEKLASENVKQVRFELGRADARAQERLDAQLAEKERRRGEDREEARRLKEEERKKQEREEQRREEKRREEQRREEQRKDEQRKEEQRKEEQRKKEEEQARKKADRDERKKEKTKSTGGELTKRSNRNSMTQAQLEEQRRLLAAEALHMQGERAAADAYDREEVRKEKESFLTKAEQSGYYDPRGGNRSLANEAVARRPSVSRRNSVNSGARRPSVIQTSPPTQPQSYSARKNGPPISFPANFNQDYATRPTPRRPSSYIEANPFAQPPSRGSGSSIDNPFVNTSSVVSAPNGGPDPWDVRVIQDSLPSTRQAPVRVVQEALPSTRQASTKQLTRVGSHNAARQATHAMGRVVGYEDDYDETESSEEERAQTYATRTGMGTIKGGKKKY